eukprot:TRINITY_DN381_c0_g1_i1.p2 TRINITY_DN381_c0_g1~~TRINITY_DN381_c0_g1_i1.p2  ORF type:complete len:273 (+),score=102.99 TRINITY_DN381_c0_g1_i1:71-889(+)
MAGGHGALCIAALVAAAVADVCVNPCQPWMWAEPGAAANPCTKGDQMDMRVIVGDPMGTFADADDADATPEDERPYRTYFFCPEVDRFTSLQANGSLAVLRNVAELDANATSLRMAVYGTGRSYETRIPDALAASSAVVYEANHPKCDGGAAAASFLVYNVTLDGGEYKYKGGDPVGNGFVNTCNDRGDYCMFDSAAFCIGSNGTSNCAACVTPEKSSDLKVLMSYYGTDKGGKTLLSGSSNPLNFRQFAVGNLYADVKNDVSTVGLEDVGL